MKLVNRQPPHGLPLVKFSILGGILLNIGIIYGEFEGGTTGGYHYSHSDECPNCGSGDTDGNNCYDCGKYF